MDDIKFFIWKILVWIDNNINHGIIEEVFNLISFYSEEKFDLGYWLWEHTGYKFCNWVIIDLYERWNIDSDIKLKQLIYRRIIKWLSTKLDIL